MPEFDFSQLQTLTTPEAWIKNAVKIPQKNQKPHGFLRPSIIGLAASLVMVAAAVLTLLLHSGGTQPPKPADSMAVQPATATAATEPVASAEASVSSTAPSGLPSAAASAASTGTNGTTAATQGAVRPSTATAPVTELPSQASTAATQPYVTQPATQPLTQLLTEPTDDIETGFAPATEWFQGTVAVLLAYDSPFADKDAAYVRFDTKDGFCGVVSITPPTEDLPSFENAEEFCPYDCGVYVPVGEPCTVTVYDNSGNRKTYSMVFPLAGTILLKV